MIYMRKCDDGGLTINNREADVMSNKKIFRRFDSGELSEEDNTTLKVRDFNKFVDWLSDRTQGR